MLVWKALANLLGGETLGLTGERPAVTLCDDIRSSRLCCLRRLSLSPVSADWDVAQR